LKDTGKKNFLKGQIGFISNSFFIPDGLLFPLWKELSLTWTGFCGFVENIESNVKELKERQEK
jgi:hypothetical protein